MAEHFVVDPASLQFACDKVMPGDVVLLAPGVYSRPSRWLNRSGEPGK